MLASEDADRIPRSNAKPENPNNPEQHLWLTQTKNGDRAAFSHIVKEYERSIYNLCYRMLNNVEDAEDAAQEVFVRAYARLDSYDDTNKFSTWLFSIASHHCIDCLRKRRFRLVSWDDLEGWYPLPNQDTPQPEAVLIEAEAVQETQNLLKMLPPDYRLVVILKYWYAMSYQEIAQMRQTTVGAIKSKLFRARRIMAAHIVRQSPPHRSQANQMVPEPGYH